MYQNDDKGPKERTWVAAARTFLVEVGREMKDISWPDWREVRSTAVIVVIVVVVIAAYVYGVNQICIRVIDHMLLRHQ